MKQIKTGVFLTVLRHLLQDRSGGVAAIFGLAVIPLFAAIGLAVDTGRGFMIRSKLSYAIDSAGLAGGRAFDQDNREAEILMFFNANFPDGYMGSTLASGHPIITFDDAENTVTIEAQVTMPTRFMRIAGVEDIDVSARTVIQRELRGLELALVMDNTGSMRSGGKMDAMKDAAQDLVEILYGDRETVPNFWVSVVPYAAMVNVGSQHTDWLYQQAYDPDAAWQNADPDSSEEFGYHPDHFQPTTWKGCVEARPYPNDSNDATPDVEGWYPHLWRTTLERFPNPDWAEPGDLDGDGDVDQDDYDLYYNADYEETWGEYLNGDNDWNPDGPLSDLDESNGAENDGTGPNLGCGPPITPLVASKTTVQAAIANMQPWHRGGTFSNLGLAWGWRTLSPNWRGLWDGDDPAEMPLDYDEPNMEKVVILLTDGNNQWYDWPGATWGSGADKRYSGLPGSSKYPNSSTLDDDYPGADYTAYGRLSEGRLGTTNNNAVDDAIDDRMFEMCTTMKDSEIIIYTITFGGSPGSATQNLFRACASEDDMYFHAPSNSTLQQVFATIADELSNLRIAE